MSKSATYVVIGAIIVYIAFFTHPPPLFVSLILKSPVGQVLALLAVVGAFMKNQPIGLLLGVAYLVSSYPVLEYLDAAEQKPQPKANGVPKPAIDMKGLESLMKMAGKGGKLPQAKGKDETKPPPPTHTVKPHSDAKVTEKFSSF
jgi:hypothetical protein